MTVRRCPLPRWTGQLSRQRGKCGGVREAAQQGMIALDTNIVVRLLVRDDPVQTAQAATVVRDNRVLLTTSVLLESEWVLRSRYRVQRSSIVEGLRAWST